MGHGQQSPGPEQGVGLAAMMTQDLVLDPQPALIETPVGQVRSDRRALSVFLLVGFSGPSPEPDVGISPFGGFATTVVIPSAGLFRVATGDALSGLVMAVPVAGCSA